MNGKNITNARFIQVNQLPQIYSNLTAKLHVENYLDKSSLVRSNQDNNLSDSKLTNVNCNIVSRGPTSDIELSTKRYIDNELDKNTIFRFNQTLQNYLKVSVGNDSYILSKYDKIQLADVTEIRYPNKGVNLLPKWRIKNLNKNNGAYLGKFLKSTVTSSPTDRSWATNLPPIGISFMYVESSSVNHGHDRVFVSWERTDIIQISNITFYYNRLSFLTDDLMKSMGRCRIQLLLEDNI